MFGGSKKNKNKQKGGANTTKPPSPTPPAKSKGAAPPAAPANANVPVIAAHYELPPEPTDALTLQLREYLLSPVACTEKAATAAAKEESGNKMEVMDEGQVGALLRKYVEGVDGMMDRTGSLDLCTLFGLTYNNGLPIYASNPAVQQHTILAIRTIFHEIAHGTRSDEFKRKTLTRLVDAARACQAEQGRVIDAVYGFLTGRDASLRDQVLSVVDSMKDLVMENLVHKLNPDAWKQSDDIPQKQVPHITSSYRIAVGPTLGLRGVESAKLDHCKFVLQDADTQKVLEAFRRMFVIEELCDMIVNDVNQQAKDADRLINRDLLAKWAGNADENNGFASHSIFYDEDNPDAYKDLGKPTEENMYQPFLNRKVALEVLRCLFLASPNKKTKIDK